MSSTSLERIRSHCCPTHLMPSNCGPRGIHPRLSFNDPSAQSYTGGQAYFIPQSDPGTYISTIAVDHSSVVRGQLLGGTPANLLFAVYPNTLVIPGPAFWNQTVSGNWNVGSNWSSQAVPSGAGVEADFLSSTSSVGGAGSPTKNGLVTPGNVYTDVAQTVGIMNFDNANGYVIDSQRGLADSGGCRKQCRPSSTCSPAHRKSTCR